MHSHGMGTYLPVDDMGLVYENKETALHYFCYMKMKTNSKRILSTIIIYGLLRFQAPINDTPTMEHIFDCDII
jgi:hypothetical protein